MGEVRGQGCCCSRSALCRSESTSMLLPAFKPELRPRCPELSMLVTTCRLNSKPGLDCRHKDPGMWGLGRLC